MYNHEHWLNLRELWTGWPNRELEGSMKWYYLIQFAFWLQQILVVNIEELRKDFWQMFTHHIITCILMFASYGYHQTKVGNVILCLMDVVDLFLSVSPANLKQLDRLTGALDRQDSQIPPVPDRVRCYIRRLYGRMADHTTHLVHDRRLFDICRHSERDHLWLLLRQY